MSLLSAGLLDKKTFEGPFQLDAVCESVIPLSVSSYWELCGTAQASWFYHGALALCLAKPEGKWEVCRQRNLEVLQADTWRDLLPCALCEGGNTQVSYLCGCPFVTGPHLYPHLTLSSPLHDTGVLMDC